MKIIVRNIRVPLAASDGDIMEQAQKRLAPLLDKKNIADKYIYRRSFDVRHKDISVVCSVIIDAEVLLSDEVLKNYDSTLLKESDPLENLCHGDKATEHRPVIIGFGPCGMFCAYMLARVGYRPIVLERGENVLSRSQKVGRFLREGVLDTESNIQFGAGGAGTFSDGKLVTRINDERTGYVLKTLYENGAPREILTQAKPHIGTDKLLYVVSNMDMAIRQLGGEIRYNSRVDGIKTDSCGNAVSVSVNGEDIPCSVLVIAIGHSARDTVNMLKSSDFFLESKPFSVGVRIEHLREDIEKSMFGDNAGNQKLPADEYAFSKRAQDDCVYTFCTCPGGEVIAAASEDGGVVTNGMSRYSRNGRNSNSALVVSVNPEGDPIEFQRRLENRAFFMGGGDYKAPVQTVGDCMSGKWGTSPKRVIPTYRKGV